MRFATITALVLVLATSVAAQVSVKPAPVFPANVPLPRQGGDTIETNAEMHERTTAVEILDDFSEIGLDYWVTGFGTSGTLAGVSRVLKKQSPKTQIVVCEPDNSPILASGVTR